MRVHRIVFCFVIVLGVTLLVARPVLSGRDALSHDFLSRPTDTDVRSPELDALERQPAFVVYPGRWAFVDNAGGSRKRHLVEFKGDGRFAADYTVTRGDRVVVDEAHAGTYAIRGRTIVFELQAKGRRVVHRVRVASVDGIHLVLETAGDGPLRFTRIFDAQTALAYAP